MSASSGRRLIIEADGGSRGNPGKSGYGAVVLDGSTGELLAEAYDYLGIATNNFAEYHGLIAGLRAAREIDPDAYVEARMDSRLVVEQMSGRWQVKHPDMRNLAREAAEVAASFGSGHVTYQWIPRERNTRADRLANVAMDAGGVGLGSGSGSGSGPGRGRVSISSALDTDRLSYDVASERPAVSRGSAALRGSAASGQATVSGRAAAPGRSAVSERSAVSGAASRPVTWPIASTSTTLVLVRHGVTTFTVEKRFSGTGDPPLIEAGRAQARVTAARLRARGGIDRLVSSPLSRCRETAQIIAKTLDLEFEVDDDLREVDFGAWEGLTYPVVSERWPRELALWQGDPSISPPDGESYVSLRHRVTAAQQRIVNRHRGETVCVVTHSRPIAMFAATLLEAPLASLYRLHVDNAGVTELDYYVEAPAVLRTFNDVSHLQ